MGPFGAGRKRALSWPSPGLPAGQAASLPRGRQRQLRLLLLLSLLLALLLLLLAACSFVFAAPSSANQLVFARPRPGGRPDALRGSKSGAGSRLPIAGRPAGRLGPADLADVIGKWRLEALFGASQQTASDLSAATKARVGRRRDF